MAQVDAGLDLGMNGLGKPGQYETSRHKYKDHELPNIGAVARCLASTQTLIVTQQSSFLVHQTAKGRSSLRGRPSVLLYRKVDWDYEANPPPLFLLQRFRSTINRVPCNGVILNFRVAIRKTAPLLLCLLWRHLDSAGHI